MEQKFNNLVRIYNLLLTLHNGIAAFMIKIAALVLVLVFMSIIFVLKWRVQYRHWTELLLLFLFLKFFENPGLRKLFYLLEFITTLITTWETFTIDLQFFLLKLTSDCWFFIFIPIFSKLNQSFEFRSGTGWYRRNSRYQSLGRYWKEL